MKSGESETREPATNVRKQGQLASRERIAAACAHREPDLLPVDFGGFFQTGIHGSIVYRLRQALELDAPGTPVRVVEIAPDLQAVLGVDAVSLNGTGTMFGFPQIEFKTWRMPDGTPALVPQDFNTLCEPIRTNGTDFGTQDGPFCSVSKYRELYLPYQERVNGWIHQHTNWQRLLRCCGGIAPLLDSVVEAEFDILNPVQCSAKGMDARTLKQRYGSQLVFWFGGVDTQHVLPFGTPQEVREQVRERIENLAPGGGFVFSIINKIVANTPLENILAMFETLLEYRK